MKVDLDLGRAHPSVINFLHTLNECQPLLSVGALRKDEDLLWPQDATGQEKGLHLCGGPSVPGPGLGAGDPEMD